MLGEHMLLLLLLFVVAVVVVEVVAVVVEKWHKCGSNWVVVLVVGRCCIDGNWRHAGDHYWYERGPEAGQEHIVGCGVAGCYTLGGQLEVVGMLSHTRAGLLMVADNYWQPLLWLL